MQGRTLPAASPRAADQLAKVGARGGLVEPAGGDDLVEELAAGDELEDDEDAGARGEHLRRGGWWSWDAAREAERRQEKAREGGDGSGGSGGSAAGGGAGGGGTNGGRCGKASASAGREGAMGEPRSS